MNIAEEPLREQRHQITTEEKRRRPPRITQPTPGNHTMFYFKACPKCQGDLTLEKDAYGEYKKCLQCGTLIDVRGLDIGDSLTVTAKKKGAAGMAA